MRELVQNENCSITLPVFIGWNKKYMVIMRRKTSDSLNAEAILKMFLIVYFANNFKSKTNN